MNRKPETVLPGLAFLALSILLTFLPACRGAQEGAAKAKNEPARNIRTTDPLSPEEERLALRLPPGFEAQLFASEPDIGKPMNIAFDDRGRLWVTQSYEYPFPDTTGAGRDRISILEDTDGDGRADVISTFADSLNIPIGIQPMPDGAIAYSIPYIWHLVDQDGDDRVDERRPLYGPFQYDDTHGMVNNFVRSWDGWVHADHGFANTSRVAGSDGDTLVLNSGNTFRFRPDGSHLEFTTTGRVNPFGYAYDEWGYTYSVDCHTSPVYQLVRGADYPHFGKRPTGIGFGPALMKHDYGSTALAGLEYYLGDHFPATFQNNFYYGDVVLSRVLRGSFRMQGTTPVFEQEADFIVSDDPWFRPVDVKLGPDGALYIADFYNRIIGHYEVPLDHPGRDRQRGRIWRIVYTGEGAETPKPVDHSGYALAELVDALGHPNLPLRMAFADQIADRFGEGAVAALQEVLAGGGPAGAKIQALWLLHRLDGLAEPILLDALNQANDTLRVHALRILFERSPLSPALLEAAAGQLRHPSPHVRRQAVMVLGQNPRTEHLGPLLDRLAEEDEKDTHFYYSIRQALRDQLRSPAVLAWVNEQAWPEAQRAALADAIRGVDAPGAGRFLLRHLAGGGGPEALRTDMIRHAARWLPATQTDRLAAVLAPGGGETAETSYPAFLALRAGLGQGGQAMGPRARAWAEQLARHFLTDPLAPYAGWRVQPIDRLPYRGNQWQLVDSTDAPEATWYLASAPMDHGGNNTSTAQSPPFAMPATLRFLLRGHKSPSGTGEASTAPRNQVRLILTETGEALRSAWIDRPHQFDEIQWSGDEHTGQAVQLVLVDGSPAWGEYLAVGGLDEAALPLPRESPAWLSERQSFAAGLAGDLGRQDLAPELRQLLLSPVPDVEVRRAAAAALLALDDQQVLATLRGLLAEPLSAQQKELWLRTLGNTQDPDLLPLIAPHLPELPFGAQREVVLALAGTPRGAGSILAASAEDRINPGLLADPQVRERLEQQLPAGRRQALGELLAGLGDQEAARTELIARRVAEYRTATPDLARGRQLFTSHCAVCHRVDEQGGSIGPQLDGIANWGPRALAEKIIAPNRNISRAFKTYTITLVDGTVRSGLFRREEGAVLVFADAAGQEFQVARKDIARQEASPYTLMPDHFGQTISEEDFDDLLGYLLSLRSI